MVLPRQPVVGAASGVKGLPLPPLQPGQGHSHTQQGVVGSQVGGMPCDDDEELELELHELLELEEQEQLLELDLEQDEELEQHEELQQEEELLDEGARDDEELLDGENEDDMLILLCCGLVGSAAALFGSLFLAPRRAGADRLNRTTDQRGVHKRKWLGSLPAPFFYTAPGSLDFGRISDLEAAEPRRGWLRTY